MKKLKQIIESLIKNPADEQLLALDIGSSSIKLVEINVLAEKPVLTAVGAVPVPGGVFSNNTISDTQEVGNLIQALITKSGAKAKKAVVCLPGPAAFVKKITIPYISLKEFNQTIKFEAANYIPDDLDAVHLDYQVLKHNKEKGTMEVLLVAVKNEIIQSFLDAVELGGVQPVIAEIDYFALSNALEKSYPESALGKAVAIVDIGARYARVSIMDQGLVLFSGDISVGSKMYNDALKDSLGLGSTDAEKAKSGTKLDLEGVGAEQIKSTLDATSQQLVSELHRQLKFFLGAAELSKDIEEYYLTGGTMQVAGLKEAFEKKVGKPCYILDPFLNLECSAVSAELVDSQKYRFGVCAGTAYRRLADKKQAIE